MKKFDYSFYPTPINTVQEVIEHMHKIEEAVKETELENITAFTHTYLIITRNVATKFNNGYFNDDKAMQAFDIAFAKYYFNALKDYCQTGKTTPAWQMLFDQAKKNNRSQLLYLALGVNAHVLNDLGLTLRDEIKDSDYKSEYDLVNPVIHASIDEVLASLKEKALVYKVILKYFRYPCTLIFKTIITQWRTNAWHNFLKLNEQSLNEDKIKENALKMAKYLTLIV